MRARSGRRGTSLAIGVALVAVAQLFAPTAVARAAPGPLAAKPATSTRREQALADYAKLAIAFEPNVGQAAKGISYVARGNGFGLALSPGGLTMAFRPQADVPSPLSGWPHYVHSNPSDAAVLSIAFPGASAAPSLVAGDKLPGTVNYLLGPNRKSWHRNVPTYSRVTYQALYPGIDLEFSGAGGKLEYTYTLAAGADPNVIRLAFSGQDALSVDAAGNLVATVKGETLTQPPPVAYQTVGTERRSVLSRYFLLDAKTVGFQLGDYDHALPLTIDPVLVYSTYLGGTSTDIALGLAIDASNNAYVTGYTFSTDFPTTTGSYQTTNKGSYDVFVSKLDPTGSTLLYSTYIGGTKDDEAGAIAVEASTGRVFIVGVTDSTAYPTTTGAYQKTFKGGTWDAFLTKLNVFGSSLTYSTYIGGTLDDEAFGVTLDTAASKAMIAGLTDSTNYPTTASAYQKTNKGSYDAFVTKIDPNPNVALSFSTYLGGTGDDEALGIVRADTADREFVVGLTSSTAFPTTTGAFQTTNKGGYDAFFTKMNKLGSTLNYSTYLGGTSDDFGVAVTADAASMGYVTGETLSTNFPTTAGVFQTTGHGDDAFVTKVNPNAGVALPYSTYLAGSAIDVGRAIAVDSGTNVYLTGNTDSNDFPTSGGAIRTFIEGASDAFATELDPNAAVLLSSTYLGGTVDEAGTGIAGAASGTMYVAGITDSGSYPTANGAYQPAQDGGYDAFVTKIADGVPLDAVVYNSGFTIGNGALGQTIDWEVVDYGNSHSITDGSGMGLFDSGPRPDQSIFALRIDAAGNYPLVDTVTSNTGNVSVPMGVVPASGSPVTVFTATWADSAPPPGYVYDVQIERPGSSVFVDWMTGVASLSAAFVPDGGVGTYSFQARIRNLSNGKASNYSVAAPITVTAINVTDSGFDPAVDTVSQGTAVYWSFSPTNAQNHSATDASGMGLFDSGAEPPGGNFSYAFVGAGTYPVVDTPTSNAATIVVPLTVTPSDGDASTTFTVTWASAPPPAGYVFDAQIERPNTGTFVDWMTGVTTTSVTFLPDAGDGSYEFQARVRQLANGSASAYSPATTISVASWPQSRDEPDQIAFNAAEVAINSENVSTLQLRWSIYTNYGTGVSVVSGGTVYTGTPLGVYALDASTGVTKWFFSGGGPASGAAVAVVGSTVYVPSGSDLLALDASTGVELWSVTLANPIASSPTVSNGMIYVSTQAVAPAGAFVYAIDATTHQTVWTLNSTQSFLASPAVSNGTLYVGGSDAKVYAVDALTGISKWSPRKLNSAIQTPISVSGSSLFVGVTGKGLYAIDPSTGATQWTAKLPAAPSPVAVANGSLFVGANSRLFEYNAAGCGNITCQFVWESTMEMGKAIWPSVAGDVAYLTSANGFLYAYNANGCGASVCAQLFIGGLGNGVQGSVVVVNGIAYADWGVISAFSLPNP